jgi:predicted NBD/HSP70 family sugar kinase
MPASARALLLTRPKIPAPLDPNFSPLILGKRNYLEHAKGCTDKLEWALIHAPSSSDGVGRYSLPVFNEDSKYFEASVYLSGILIQEAIYQRGVSSLLLSGPRKICEAVKSAYSPGGAYEFELNFIPVACGFAGKAFEVKIVPAEELPSAKETPIPCGKEANGCRLAYDLGKSDIKTVAVKDNEILYSKETEWDVTNPDPQYHFDSVLAALKLAKETLPQVDSVGGSTTGTVSVDCKAIWCDLFPNVPQDVFEAKVVDFHKRLAKEVAGDVPMKVINDGEVTALAAVQKIKAGNVLGISMGSTEGAGYANADGHLLGWMNEFGFYKLDLNPEAPIDPWTEGHHTGCSHLYLGQRAASKLAHKVIEVPENMVYPHDDMLGMYHALHANCLKLVQKAMADPKQESTVRLLYETMGVYLGYALAQYSEFYKIDHVMVLGRVSKGKGGDVMFEKAREVMNTEFPELKIELHSADDHFKAVGQCIAAAALPILS